MHDEVAHMGVIDGLLGFRLPGSISGGVVGINADDVQLVEIPEFDVVQIGELAAEDEMQQLSVLDLIRHRLHSSIPVVPEPSPLPTTRIPLRPRKRLDPITWSGWRQRKPRWFDHANSASRSRMRPSNSACRARPAATSAP